MPPASSGSSRTAAYPAQRRHFRATCFAGGSRTRGPVQVFTGRDPDVKRACSPRTRPGARSDDTGRADRRLWTRHATDEPTQPRRLTPAPETGRFFVSAARFGLGLRIVVRGAAPVFFPRIAKACRPATSSHCSMNFHAYPMACPTPATCLLSSCGGSGSDPTPWRGWHSRDAATTGVRGVFDLGDSELERPISTLDDADIGFDCRATRPGPAPGAGRQAQCTGVTAYGERGRATFPEDQEHAGLLTVTAFEKILSLRESNAAVLAPPVPAHSWGVTLAAFPVGCRAPCTRACGAVAWPREHAARSGQRVQGRPSRCTTNSAASRAGSR